MHGAAIRTNWFMRDLFQRLDFAAIRPEKEAASLYEPNYNLEKEDQESTKLSNKVILFLKWQFFGVS